MFGGHFLVLCLLALASVALVTESLIVQSEIDMFKSMKPLIDKAPSIMFWRPQKVGSSTIVGILASYGFRFNSLPRYKSSSNHFCKMMRICGENITVPPGKMVLYKGVNSDITIGTSRQRNKTKAADRLANEIPFRISLGHEICNMDSKLMHKKLQCSFNRPVKEVLLVREPVARAVSAYYFWGELFKMQYIRKHNKPDSIIDVSKVRLGGVRGNDTSTTESLARTTYSGKFTYHGEESTVPPEDLAISFAKNLPFTTGMPGPSYTWSLFANSLKDALRILQQPERLMTLVTERLDESLVVMMHYLNTEYVGTDVVGTRADWGLADLVYVTRRKSLSTHPKATKWPASAVRIIDTSLHDKGEFAVFEEANQALDTRISDLTRRGVDIRQQVQTLGQLRERVSEMCFTNEYLNRYKKYLQAEGLQAHQSANKLRDVEDRYSEAGHEFSINREILYSFDVCGNCEAHAILVSLEHDLGSKPSANTIMTATVLKDLSNDHRAGRLQLQKCP